MTYYDDDEDDDDQGVSAAAPPREGGLPYGDAAGAGGTSIDWRPPPGHEEVYTVDISGRDGGGVSAVPPPLGGMPYGGGGFGGGGFSPRRPGPGPAPGRPDFNMFMNELMNRQQQQQPRTVSPLARLFGRRR